ncbi:hypothetical protein IAR50_003906 [Cryptococcus sp. DSM 104548]
MSEESSSSNQDPRKQHDIPTEVILGDPLNPDVAAYIFPQFQEHQQQLAKLGHLKDELDHTVTILDRLSRKGLLDPTRDYRLLTNGSARVLVQAAGSLISENPDAVLHNSHREWSAADASRWAQHLHHNADDLAVQGRIFIGETTANSTKDTNKSAASILNAELDKVLPGGDAASANYDAPALTRFAQSRHLVDGLRSYVISEEALPSLVNKIHSQLANAHPAKVDAAPSTRKKNKNNMKWDQSFSDIEGAVSWLNSSCIGRWRGKKETFGELEEGVERLHTALTEYQEKIVRRKQYEYLFNRPGGLEEDLYDSSRVGDLGELLTNRIKHLQRSWNGLEDTYKAATMTGHEGASDPSFLLLHPPEDDTATISKADVSNFGIPTEKLLQPAAHDHLSQKLNTLVIVYEYRPETDAFRPSIAQSYMRSLVGLRDQVHHRFDQFLSDNADGNVTEGAPRSDLLEAFHTKRQSMERSTDIRGAARFRLTREYDQASKIETKYDALIERLVRSLYTKVKTARNDYERIHDEQRTKQSRVDSYRANADFYAATGFLKEHYPEPAADGIEMKNQQRDRQRDIVTAKEYLDKAWNVSRMAEESPVALEVLLDEISLEPKSNKAEENPVEALVEETFLEAEQSDATVQDVSQNVSQDLLTATAKPWKSSSFDWAEADENDDQEWWKEQSKIYGFTTTDDDQVSSRKSSNVWFKSPG